MWKIFGGKSKKKRRSSAEIAPATSVALIEEIGGRFASDEDDEGGAAVGADVPSALPVARFAAPPTTIEALDMRLVPAKAYASAGGETESESRARERALRKISLLMSWFLRRKGNSSKLMPYHCVRWIDDLDGIILMYTGMLVKLKWDPTFVTTYILDDGKMYFDVDDLALMTTKTHDSWTTMISTKPIPVQFGANSFAVRVITQKGYDDWAEGGWDGIGIVQPKRLTSHIPFAHGSIAVQLRTGNVFIESVNTGHSFGRGILEGDTVAFSVMRDTKQVEIELINTLQKMVVDWPAFDPEKESRGAVECRRMGWQFEIIEA
jgi:hypothetical protein